MNYLIKFLFIAGLAIVALRLTITQAAVLPLGMSPDNCTDWRDTGLGRGPTVIENNQAQPYLWACIDLPGGGIIVYSVSGK